MNHIHWYPRSKEAEFYKLLLNYDESLERDLADCGAIWYESWTQNLMVWDYRMSDRIASMVVSKYYWFIKRLVDNDKIDQTNKFCVSVNVEWKGMGYTKAFEGYESLLMLLSIQEEPINFLLSILK